MNNTDKYFNDEEFIARDLSYTLVVYPSRKNANSDTNGHVCMRWYNNDLTYQDAKNILMGMDTAATIKYKHPVAALFVEEYDGTREILNSCCG